MKKTLTHRLTGARLVLDSSEIFPDDPGDGTPAMVEYNGGAASYTFATGEGIVCTNRHDVELPADVLQWLDSECVSNEIEAMYKSGRNGEW